MSGRWASSTATWPGRSCCPFAAALLFLTQILLATQILAQADVLFGSGVSLVDLGMVILGLMPHFLGFVLPVAFLLGAVLGVGRLAEDREVMALGAAGLSPARLVRVPLLLGVLLAAGGVWLSLSLEPAGMRAVRLRLNEIVKRNVTNDVRPGTFYDQIPGYTLYAERVRGGRWENVLIHDRSTESAPMLALARRGRLEPVGAGEEMRLVLEDGEVHREEPDTDEYATAAFGRAEVMIGLGTTLKDRSSLASSSASSGSRTSARASPTRRPGATARRPCASRATCTAGSPRRSRCSPSPSWPCRSARPAAAGAPSASAPPSSWWSSTTCCSAAARC